MKNIILFYLFLILSFGCRNASNQTETSNEPEESNVQKDSLPQTEHDTSHTRENGKFGCIPNASIILEADKFFTVKIPGDTKDYIYFKNAVIHTFVNDKITGSYTQDSIYLEINNVAFAHWNDAIESLQDLNKIQVGICSRVFPHPGNTTATQKFIFKRGAIFKADNLQIEPHRLTCNCYEDCYNSTSVQYWNNNEQY